jgi:hypothetical protein
VREAFLDFLGEPKDSIRRTRPGGIFEAYDIISGEFDKALEIIKQRWLF